MSNALAPFGTAVVGDTIRWVTVDENEPGPYHLKQMESKLTLRAWDVTDPAAQRLAAEEERGDLAAYPPCSLQWFIHPQTNSAVLLVFREPRCSSMPLSSTNS